MDKNLDPTAVHQIRSAVRTITESILKSRGSSSSNVLPSSSFSASSSLNSSKSSTPPDDSDRKRHWDETCIGVWIKDGTLEDGKDELPRCFGINIIKTNSPEPIDRYKCNDAWFTVTIISLTAEQSSQEESGLEKELGNEIGKERETNVMESFRSFREKIGNITTSQFNLVGRLSDTLKLNEEKLKRAGQSSMDFSGRFYEKSADFLGIATERIRTWIDNWRK